MHFLDLFLIFLWFFGGAVAIVGFIGVVTILLLSWLTQSRKSKKTEEIIKRMLKKAGLMVLFGLIAVASSYGIEKLVDAGKAVATHDATFGVK